MDEGWIHRYEYSTFVTLNERPKPIWISEAWYGGYNWSGGAHDKHSGSSGPVYPPYDKEARFVWRDWNGSGDGPEHRQTVRIDPPIPDSFTGRIYFRFQPDGSIKVTLVPWEDWQRHYGIDMSEKEVLQWKERQGR